MAKSLAGNPRSLQTVYLVAMFVALAAALYCGALAAQQKDLPKPDATALWSYLQKQDFQKNFKQFPGKQPLYKGQEPHGMLLTTYVNDIAHNALSKRAQQMPVGSIIVKENYTPDRVLAATTVMYKAAGFDAPNQWFWLKRSANGTVDAAGRAQGCIGCHAASKRDYVLTPLP